MPIRIKDIATTASASSNNDFLAIDGLTNNTRKLSAFSPVFGGSVTANSTGSFFGDGGAAVADRALTVRSIQGSNFRTVASFVNTTTGTGATTSLEIISDGTTGFLQTYGPTYGTGAYASGAFLVNGGANAVVGLSAHGAGGYIKFIQQSFGNEIARFSPTNANLLIGGTTDIPGTGGVKIFGNSAATGTTSGALQVVGGVGVQGRLHVNGVTTGGDNATHITFVRNGILDIGPDSTATPSLVVSNNLTVSGTGTSTISGTLRVNGIASVGTAPDVAIGFNSQPTLTTGTFQYGVYSSPSVNAATSDAGFFSMRTAAGSAVGSAFLLRAFTPTLGASSTITNAFGLRIENIGATGVTNAYGIDIAAQTGASATNVGLRNAGVTLLNDTYVAGGNGFNIDTSGSGSIRWNDAGAQRWWIYKLSGDPNLYLRDQVNARMQATFTPAATSSFASTTFWSTLFVDSSNNSTSWNTGALQVAGGIGAAGALFSQQSTNAIATGTNFSNTSTGAAATLRHTLIAGANTSTIEAYGATHGTFPGRLRFGTNNGQMDFVPSGVVGMSIAATGVTIPNPLTVSGSTSVDGLATSGFFGGSKRVVVGYNTTNDYGFVASTDTGVGWKDLYLNPFGGVIKAGGSVVVNPLHTPARHIESQVTFAANSENYLRISSNSGGGIYGGEYGYGLTSAGDPELRINRIHAGTISNVLKIRTSDGAATFAGAFTASGTSSFLRVSNITQNTMLADFSSPYAGGTAFPYLVLGSASDPNISGARIAVGTDYSNNYAAALFFQTRNTAGTIQTSLSIANNQTATFSSSVTTGGKVEVQRLTQPNDTSEPYFTGLGGTDATLGALIVHIGGRTSATGGNRYGYISVGDNAAMRPLSLCDNGTGGYGQVLVRSSSNSNDNISGALVVTGGVGIGGNVNMGGRLFINNTSAANGALSSSAVVATFGADATLGGLGFTVKGFPSATAGSRYIQLAAADALDFRELRINDLGGNVGIGGSSSTITVGGPLIANAASNAFRIPTAQTPASQTATGTTGQITWDSSYIYVCTATNNWGRSSLSWSGGGGGGTSAQVDTYTTTGSVLTWTKPAGAKAVEIIAFGAGGGGGGGAGNASAVLRNGGGGGGGGACTKICYQADQVPSSLYVVVGLGGTGGASQVAGVAGTNSTVASNNTNPPTTGVFARAGGGGGGGPGGITDNGGGGGGGCGGAGATSASTATSIGGAPAVAYTNAAVGGQGGGGGHTQNNGGGRAEYGGGGGGNGRINLDNFRFRGGGSMYGGGGGGSGCGLNAAGTVAGGTGGGPSGSYEGAFTAADLNATLPGGAAVAANNGTAGTAAGTTYPAGGGGGGGGGNNAGTGFTGGAGGFPCGGGGGGGASSSTGGTGGAGANGQVVIITYF